MADKIATAQERQEEKLAIMQRLDLQKDEEKRQAVIKVEEERRRHKEAMERARQD